MWHSTTTTEHALRYAVRMTENPTITVRGEAALQFPAERGTVTLQTTVASPDREKAYSTVVEVYNRLAKKAQGFIDDQSATWHRATVPTISSSKQKWQGEFDEEPQERVIHHVSATILVKFQDFHALGEWLSDLAEEEIVVVRPTEWSLTGTTRKAREAEVRKLALANARKRAAEFMEAEGVTMDNLRLVEAAEEAAAPKNFAGAMRASAPVAEGYTPDEISLQAAVLARFVAVEY